MATDKLIADPSARRALIALAIGVVGILVAGFLALFGYGARTGAAPTAAYDARMVCSCRYVAGRSLADCRRDRAPHGWPVWLVEDTAAHTITARVPSIARETARWHAGQGCVLDRRD